MGIFDRMFGKGNLKPPKRHRQAAYMNLAYKILPAMAVMTAADPLAHLTDEHGHTHLTTDGEVGAAATGTLIIDLGQIYEVYEINVSELAGGGFEGGVTEDETARLLTNDGAGYVERAAQNLGNGWQCSAIDYVGEGIPVRYVQIEVFGGTDTASVDLSEIEVFGC